MSLKYGPSSEPLHIGAPALRGGSQRLFGSLIFLDPCARRNLAACGTNPGSSKRRFSPPDDWWGCASSSVLLSSLELSDTNVYEPLIRALLGTAAHFSSLGRGSRPTLKGSKDFYPKAKARFKAKTSATFITLRRRANVEQVSQSSPDSGRGLSHFQGESLQNRFSCSLPALVRGRFRQTMCLRATTLQNCAVVPRRARIRVS